MPRTAAANHSRPCLSIMPLWLLVRWLQIFSSPQYGDGGLGFGMALRWSGGPSVGGVGVAHGHLEERHLVGLRIQDRHVVARIFGRAEERAVSINRRIAPVRRDQVVQMVFPWPTPMT